MPVGTAARWLDRFAVALLTSTKRPGSITFPNGPPRWSASLTPLRRPASPITQTTPASRHLLGCQKGEQASRLSAQPRVLSALAKTAGYSTGRRGSASRPTASRPTASRPTASSHDAAEVRPSQSDSHLQIREDDQERGPRRLPTAGGNDACGGMRRKRPDLTVSAFPSRQLFH